MLRFARPRPLALGACAVAATAVAATAGGDSPASAASGTPTTTLLSRSFDGGMPNGPSSNAVISNDKRYARVIAFQSDASDIVRGDSNGTTDVFAILRGGTIGNDGAPWHAGQTVLISRAANGGPANGPSFDPAVDGSFHHTPKCVAFLSSASNLVGGDTNGKVDAFVSRLPSGRPKRISLPSGRQSSSDTKQVAVSGDCSRIAFVTGKRLYVWVKGHVHRVHAKGSASDPSFSTGLRNDLVFAARGGVYLARNATGRPHRVVRGGKNPAYNDIKRQVVTYQKRSHGRWQVYYRDLHSHHTRLVSAFHGRRGNGNSTNAVIGNSGFYVAFQTTASNLGTTADSRRLDHNHAPDVYLYTDVRHITLAESVMDKGVPMPGGGEHPSMSFYANYITFDSPVRGSRQVYMRYLGGL